ncbi:16S rRNA (cytosine(1402)-N(4))-methyltransferase RsmH [Phorcysia thermohydrogeniphila]|uniref:Ribosomal RNA small subunit methyltransferase H n=1 Tax=Phorcysia thermohydrogeniphila TaxID=936138 RepID=A0A4V2PDC3_9BACT|nr:16S rRNA (cytosine(1402)-N(4))-methyltransferase RsmH [Phorcysia thermohydrogeniphila]TCK04626.1 16S rRNA (cytosine1402-N4)-methyltransferase [Phorcysia thermohydrogeniphila]
MEIYHPPVMLKEAIEYLKAEEGGIFVDATLGGGGHTEAILKANPKNRVIAIDRDEEAIERALKRLEPFGNRISIYHANFSQIGEVLESEGVEKVNGVLFDLGVSHFHLRGERGFTVWKEQPLDMRMDRRQKLTAKDVVNELSEKELAEIIFKYGEERFARKIAKEIVRKRKIKPIETTTELAKIVEDVIPKKLWAGKKKHPAIKTFQAIRIYVNKEFEEIEQGIPAAAEHLSCGGRIVVITFHSLEDRLVKNILRSLEGFKVITKKPLEPTEEELKENPAARSAKLRAVEKGTE